MTQRVERCATMEALLPVSSFWGTYQQFSIEGEAE